MNKIELDDILEKSLHIEPDFHLPVEFAQKVTTKLMRHSQWKADLSEYLHLTAFSLFLLTVVSVIYYFVDQNLMNQILTFLSTNLMQVVFALFLLNFILFADMVILRFLFNRRKMNY